MQIYYLKGETFEKHFGTKSKTKKALLLPHCRLLYSNQTPSWQEEKYPIRFLHYTNPIKSQTNKKLNIGLRLWLRLLFPPRLKSNTTNGTPLVSVHLKVDSIQFLHMLCNGNSSTYYRVYNNRVSFLYFFLYTNRFEFKPKLIMV